MEILNVNEAEIEAKVIEIVAEQMGVDKGEISRATSFTNDLNADSLDTVELVMEFEDEFDAELEQRSKLETLASWRKDLMTRLEMSATESKNEAERLNDFYDTDDVALDIELKEILENQYDARQQQ